jgi:uncharacterized phage protein gp47/JayE
VSDTCGCCTPNLPLAPIAIDNRPGLSAIAYRIGTFGSFRETMLDAIAGFPELANLTTRQSDDYAITFIELWAALLDVITFYQERHANEVFLRTAQQTVSLRRIAGLLDYRPLPGVAALADLAFTLDAGTTVQIPVGLRVQSVPAQNQQPQIYETLEAVTADSRFNRLRIFPQPSQTNPLGVNSGSAILDRIQGPSYLAALSVNDQIILFNDGGADPPEQKKIAALTVQDDMITLSWTKPILGQNWDPTANGTQAFKFRRTFRVFGYNAPPSFMQSQASNAVPGGILWSLAQTNFTTSGGTQLILDSRYSDLATGTQLLVVLVPSPTQSQPAPPSFGGLSFGGFLIGTTQTFSFGGSGILGDGAPQPAAGGFQTSLVTVTQVGQGQATTGPISDTVTQVTIDVALSPSDARNTVIFELVGNAIDFWPGTYGRSIDTPTACLPGQFVQIDQGVGIEVGRTIQQNAFGPGVVIQLPDIAAGRSVILADAQGVPIEGSVQGAPQFDSSNPVAGTFGHLLIPLQVDAVSLDTGSAVLLGNVARASNGQTVSGEVLGNGNAAQAFQSFALQQQPLTYVPSSMPGGVTSSLQLFVNQLRWTEVPELFGQPPTAQVFSTRTGDDGSTLVRGGDGTSYGATFPSGQGNVTATYRVGAGTAGQVGANSLTTLIDRLQGLTDVTNPLPADGGADPETMDTIRRNAPRTVRTFGRAVALADFEDLITASGEVAKALAAWVWDGFAPAVHLTVAGQNGGTFADLTSLGATLANARDPNHRLRLDNYSQVPIVLAANVWVDPARSQPDVTAAALQTVRAALSFDQLELGEALHLSQIYAVLQGVSGVIAADVTQFGFKNTASTFLAQRGVTFLPNGMPAPVQDFLRIFAALPDPNNPGQVLAAELAWVETPSQDVTITAQGS